MTPAQHQRATDLFEAASQRSPAERDSLLARACDDDPAVARLVRRMLLQHESPAFDLDSAPLPGPLSGILGARLNVAAFSDDACNPAAMPKQIGPYAILGILGTGGMSVVYRARQEFPDRIIALKVLRRAALSHAALRRFRMEVDTLARLSHPNIAQIYQAGSYHDGDADAEDAGGGGGRPYFAMELIEGLPLTEYAQRHRLNLRQKLELMIAVCRAVQYAHLKSVIHRDLKPGNILVMEDAADGLKSVCPIPKILDFGIARATDVDVNRATLTADTGQIVGTLPYMSPEQLSGDANSLDLRSDVYALGVILFELLTGALPHALDDAAPLTEAIRRISESEPRRLGTIDRKWRGELEVIAATAMERDRERRYQSAEALADDLQAFLDHRPIRAKPPGLALRARKWLQRHPTAATAVGLAIVAIIALAGLIAYQQQRIRAQAAADRQRAMLTATDAVQSYARDLDASRSAKAELADVRNHLDRYNPPAQALDLERRERELVTAATAREAAFHRAIDLLAEAQRLGGPPADEQVRLLHARLYLARVREAEAAGDRLARSMYLDLVRERDPQGKLAGEMQQRFPVAILSEPPGAQVHIFRLLEQSEIVSDGEPRLVPVPFKRGGGQTDAIVPGQFALRVIDGAGALQPEDLVLSVHGQPLRDSMLVIDGPAPLQRFDRLKAIGGGAPIAGTSAMGTPVVVRGRYDIAAGASMLRVENPDAERRATVRFVFTRAGVDGEMSLMGASLEALGVQVAEAATAVERLGGDVTVCRASAGKVEQITIPPGLRFRITSKPLLVGAQSLAGTTPLNGLMLERGQYIALLLKDGFEPLRVPLEIGASGLMRNVQAVVWQLQPRGSSPPGFVPVARTLAGNPQPFWIMQHEVTCGEYLEFLNDPQIRAQIDAAPAPILYPRSGGVMECGREPMPPAGSGRFTLGKESIVADDWPVSSITWHDAKAYAEWKTRRWREEHAQDGQEVRGQKSEGSQPAAGVPQGGLTTDLRPLTSGNIVFDLPTHQEWLSAWGCGGDNQFPWGMHFRPWWCSSNYAREHPDPEPVMSFAIDESNLGVFDLAGSVSEWLSAWWIEERNQREFAGGSWGHGGFNYREMFMLYGQNGCLPNITNGTCGFRLVMRKEPPG